MQNLKVTFLGLLFFTLAGPAFPGVLLAPKPLSPVVNQTGVAPTPRFAWEKVKGALSYEMQLSPDSPFGKIIVDIGGLADTIYDQTCAFPFATYCWRVKAKNGAKKSAWSKPRSFTVEMLRHFFSPDVGASEGVVSPAVKDELSYFHRLGYNYVFFYLEYTQIMPDIAYVASGPEAGHWVFNNHNYSDTSKSVVRNFKALKNAIELAGMHALPAIGDLSHQGQWINGVSIAHNGKTDTLWKRNDAASEFNSESAFMEFAHAIGLAENSADQCNGDYNTVYCADDSNKTASDIFVEQLRIIQENWGYSTLGGRYPQYINIGHDEIGQAPRGKFICLVGEGKTKDLCKRHGGGGVGKSWVIAHQIQTKYGQVSKFCDPGVKMVLWGDCFATLGNGESAGLTGNKNGDGGILQFLRDSMRLTSNCIIEPWNYWSINGSPTGYASMNFDQSAQVRFIQKFGFGYVLASGEGGGYSSGDGGMNNVNRHRQIVYEQAQASRLYPQYFYGFGEQLYVDWNSDGFKDTLAGYTAPIVAYFGWTTSEKLLNASQLATVKFDPIKSRKNLSWTLGADFALDGPSR
jgi:hypothetical protein